MVAAGGTGGHLFPALALAQALADRGWRIVLATDARVGALTADFPAESHLVLASAPLAGGPLGLLRGIAANLRGVAQARQALRRLAPAAVVGFGGYPSLPALIGAISLGRRTLIHEQNAVSGRANRLLAPYVTAIARAFPELDNASARSRRRSVLVGNPVRPAIAALAGRPYDPPQDAIRLLVTGGSQGARLISQTVPAAVARLPEALRRRMRVEHQARPEDMEAVRRTYAAAGVEAEVAPFLQAMGERLGRAHLVIGRAGASTVTEIAVAGRPAILIPLRIALDDDQGRNARALAAAGGAVVFTEAELSVEAMADTLAGLLADPDRLGRMAAGAKSLARPDAAERLADLVESIAVSSQRAIG